MPRLWAKVNGINHDISVKTAEFIIDTAALYNADVIVFEYLEKKGKKRGSKKQRLHLWKSQEVQKMCIRDSTSIAIEKERSIQY